MLGRLIYEMFNLFYPCWHRSIKQLGLSSLILFCVSSSVWELHYVALCTVQNRNTFKQIWLKKENGPCKWHCIYWPLKRGYWNTLASQPSIICRLSIFSLSTILGFLLLQRTPKWFNLYFYSSIFLCQNDSYFLSPDLKRVWKSPER